MSPLSLPQRFSQANSSTTSVNSWDVAAARSPPRAQSWNSAKPLPPTPTRPGIPSSKFNVYVEDLLPKTPTVFGSLEDIVPPNKVYQSSKNFSSSTSNLPDKLPNRPWLRRDVKTQVETGPVKARKNIDSTMFKEWKAPKYASSDDELDPDSPSLGKILETSTQDSSNPTHVAEQHAAGYMSVLHACDALLPSFDTESYSTGYNEIPSDMSASMTDIVDEYLVPHALRFSMAEESQPSSHFSSDSEGAGDYEGGVKKFRLRAKKVFHSRKTSHEKAEKIKLGSSSSKASRTGSLSPSERAGIQESIIDMYETLNRLSALSAKSNLKVECTALEDKAVPEEIQTPPSPKTTERHFERKEQHEAAKTASPRSSKSTRSSWFTRSSRQRSSKDTHSSLSSAESKRMNSFRFPQTDQKPSRDSSVGRKLGRIREAIALKTRKGKKKANAQKREDMKKKIVFVGPTDPM